MNQDSESIFYPIDPKTSINNMLKEYHDYLKSQEVNGIKDIDLLIETDIIQSVLLCIKNSNALIGIVKHIEYAYNYLIMMSNQIQSPEVFEVLTDTIEECRISPVEKFTILLNLYHSVPLHNPLRNRIFFSMIQMSGKYSVLSQHFLSLLKWIPEMFTISKNQNYNLNQSTVLWIMERAEFFGYDQELIFDYCLKYIEEDPSSDSIILFALKIMIKSPYIYNTRRLVNAINHDDFYEFIEVLNLDDWSRYVKCRDKSSILNVIYRIGIDQESLDLKVMQICIITRLSALTSGIYKLEELSNDIGISETDLEDVLIILTQKGMVDAKIDDLTRSIQLESVSMVYLHEIQRHDLIQDRVDKLGKIIKDIQ
jgi:hypothetical protein